MRIDPGSGALPLLVAPAVFSFAACNQADLAGPLAPCASVAQTAAIAAIERTRPLGQVRSTSAPYAVEPGMLRFEVNVFGAQRLIYSVDVTLDAECAVTRTNARLENPPLIRP